MQSTKINSIWLPCKIDTKPISNTSTKPNEHKQYTYPTLKIPNKKMPMDSQAIY